MNARQRRTARRARQRLGTGRAVVPYRPPFQNFPNAEVERLLRGFREAFPRIAAAWARFSPRRVSPTRP